MRVTPFVLGGASGTAAYLLANDTPLAAAMRKHPFALMGEPELGWFAGTVSYMAYEATLQPNLDMFISGLSGLTAYAALKAFI